MPLIPEDVLARYEKLVATLPDVERKGATMPYTSVNGHMFSFVTKEGAVALRLSPEDREAFLAKHEGAICEQHGRVMKEYVVIPDDLLTNTRALKKLFATSFEHVSSLKPKPTKRKASTKKKTTKKAAPKKAKKSPTRKKQS